MPIRCYSPSRCELSVWLRLAALLFLLLELSRSYAADVPHQVGKFQQQTHIGYTSEHGLPKEGIAQLVVTPESTVLARADSGGVYVFRNDRWVAKADLAASVDSATERTHFPSLEWFPSLESLSVSRAEVRDVARRANEVAVATKSGLYIGNGNRWTLAMPAQGVIRWSPIDVRAVGYDDSGSLWFAAPQGVGSRDADGNWQLYTADDGLPYNDFTCLAAGSNGVWFGTRNGAVWFHDGKWSFRHGGRWLLDNAVRDVVVDRNGYTWLATSRGVSCLREQAMTLETKAAYYADEIEKHHRRTSFGYVNPAKLIAPGDKTNSTPMFGDNDGFNTGLYLAAVSYGYSVTKDPKQRAQADRAFRAIAFLSEVTQGGVHAAPSGFIARNVIPITEDDPNQIYDHAYDLKRNKADSLWKIMRPRLPVDPTGKWYWKCDSSSDELDGHFFGYAIYYDRVCKTEEQREAVRVVVRRIIEHLLKHNYSLVDYDGLPTRWGHFSPDDLNRNSDWHDERGLNSYSILTYLTIAHHITGDRKYREAFLELALEHGYGLNGMTQPKSLEGPRSPGHQPDDNMAFLNYYHLIRYEKDPKLLSMFLYAIRTHWAFERLERNSLTNFIYGACVTGKRRRDQWGETNLTPPAQCIEDAVDTLKRYPLDLIEWPMSNAHRIDMVPLGDEHTAPARTGGRNDGYAFPIDERHETYWDWDPWRLSFDGDGKVLRPGFHYLLAYYMGRFHGFVEP